MEETDVEEPPVPADTSDNESNQGMVMGDVHSSESPKQRLMITKMVRHFVLKNKFKLSCTAHQVTSSYIGSGEFQELCGYQDHWSLSQVLQCCCWAQWIGKIQCH
jgi:hypothetical protein